MAKKQFKNVFTILEKAKKGELDVNASSPRLYSHIQYNVRGEIIKPYLHYLDEKALKTAVSSFMYEPISHQQILKIAKEKNKKLISPDTLSAEMIQIWEKFPKELVNDIFNLNYEDIERLRFEDRTEKNRFRYAMLEKANNPVSKVITRQSNLKSMVYTRSMIQYYLIMLAMLQQEDKKSFDQMMKQLSGKPGGSGSGSSQNSQSSSSQDTAPSEKDGGDGQPSASGKEQHPNQQPGSGDSNTSSHHNNQAEDNSSAGKGAGKGDAKPKSQKDVLNDVLKKFEDSSVGKKVHEEIMNNARRTVDMMENIMTEKEMEELWNDLSGKTKKTTTAAIEKTNTYYLERIEAELKRVNINLSGIKSTIKKMLDKSISFFSAKERVRFENIFDAEVMDGLQDYELLHPKLRKLFAEDINVREIERMGKIDIFIDASGSMHGSSGVSDSDGHYLTKSTFAKAFAYKMKQMNLLSKIYSFQGSVRYEGTSVFDILTIHTGGGTTIDNAVRRAESNGHNAIIITDAEDRCYTYSDKVFFVGVAGSNFTYFKPEVLAQYVDNQQIIIFDGKSIRRVSAEGYPI